MTKAGIVLVLLAVAGMLTGYLPSFPGFALGAGGAMFVVAGVLKRASTGSKPPVINSH